MSFKEAPRLSLARLAELLRSCGAGLISLDSHQGVKTIDMPSDDYSVASSGALKLKGVDSSSKIHKKRKKRAKPTVSPSRKPQEAGDRADGYEGESGEQELIAQDDDNNEPRSEPSELKGAKTEAELRFEETRRKRLNDKMKKEGTKTHKERVEELNRYLNKLSEHHDMYVLSFVHMQVMTWTLSNDIQGQRLGQARTDKFVLRWHQRRSLRGETFFVLPQALKIPEDMATKSWPFFVAVGLIRIQKL